MRDHLLRSEHIEAVSANYFLCFVGGRSGGLGGLLLRFLGDDLGGLLCSLGSRTLPSGGLGGLLLLFL